jgi:hypothetical protein
MLVKGCTKIHASPQLSKISQILRIEKTRVGRDSLYGVEQSNSLLHKPNNS